MTQQDRFVKWLLYALGVVPVWILETMILNRYPLFGVIPVLLPMAGIAVALWEGAVPGGIFGLCVGVLADAVYPGTPGGMTIGLTLLAVLTGILSKNGIKQNYPGYLMCAAGGMVLLELIRIGWGAVSGLGALSALAPVALKEFLWSICFTVPIYLLFHLIHRRVARERS